MKAAIRGLKALLVLSALAGLGLLLRWVTAGSIGAATAQDLTSMASVAIGAVAWAAYCWFVVAVLATLLEQIPGLVGRAAAAVATRITSQTSRTLLRSALGVAAVTPLTIGLAQATPGDGSHGLTHPGSTLQITHESRPWSSVEPASSVKIAGDSPADWRATEEASSIQITGSGEPSAASARTGAKPPAHPAKGPIDEVAVPDRPTAGAPTRYTHLQSGQLARGASRVVKPGDSLWSIAAAELGPSATARDIATRWPQWHAANRRLIGPDPDLIQPGQVLNPPAPSHSVPPTHQEK